MSKKDMIKSNDFLIKWKSEISLLIFLFLLICLCSLLSPEFMSFKNMMNIANQSSMTFIVAIGLTVVLTLGGMDLSVGFTAALAGMITTGSLVDGCSIPVAILLGLLVGIAVGFFNGIVITKMGIPDFIVTLASMLITEGLIYAYTGGYPIYQGIPKSFMVIGQGRLAGVPYPVIILFAFFVLSLIVFYKTRFGLQITATGGSKECARLSGIKVDRIMISGYVICGACAALAGIIMSSRLGSGQPSAGDDFLFDALGAVVLGGTSTAGGKGTIVGTLIGIFVTGVIFNGMAMLDVTFYMQKVVKGIIIVLAVAYNSYKSRSTAA